jgi:hypothetical protein
MSGLSGKEAENYDPASPGTGPKLILGLKKIICKLGKGIPHQTGHNRKVAKEGLPVANPKFTSSKT